MHKLKKAYYDWMVRRNHPVTSEWKETYSNSFEKCIIKFENKNSISLNSDLVDDVNLNDFYSFLKKKSSYGGIESGRSFIRQILNLGKIENLYQYLIENRKHELYGWFYQYKETFLVVSSVIENLKTTKDLRNKETYKGTIFEKEADPFKSFLSLLIFERSNGIASSKASNLSKVNFFETKDLFIQDDEFVNAVKDCLIEPSNQSYKQLVSCWYKQKEKQDSVVFNEALCNRVLSAANLDISSTVTGHMFAKVADYFEINCIEPFEANENNWYTRNIDIVSKIQWTLLDKELEGLDKIESKIWLNIFIWEAYEFICKPFDLKRQIIKYGAPGTGKTYSAKKEATLQFDIWKQQCNPGYKGCIDDHLDIIQFHPSFSYEDFLEGLRPVPDKETGVIELKLQNGVFKIFCKKASKWEVILHEKFNGDIDFHSFTVEDFLESVPGLFLKTHKDWEYIDNIRDTSTLLVDVLPPYFFIIDEINRAELSRVLGELMYSLENRGVSGAISTQYAQLNDSNTELLPGGKFFIPQNVFIIGTMNTIDRSVESFDFALRRRFYWQKVMPQSSIVKYEYTKGRDGTQWKSLITGWENLNEKIKVHPLLGEDYQIGHSYLLNLPFPKDTEAKIVKDKVWERTIEPLLEEYLRGTGEGIKPFKDVYFA